MKNGTAEQVKADNFIRSYCKVGLTATPLREDDKLATDLNLLGCKLFESNWSDLAKLGYVADLNCIEIECQMTHHFYQKFTECEALQSRSDCSQLYSKEWMAARIDEQKKIRASNDMKELAELFNGLNKYPEYKKYMMERFNAD